MRALKEQLKLETNEKIKYEKEFHYLNEEIERQFNMINEFAEERHSWEIKEGLNSD
jgi:hypothetical protein